MKYITTLGILFFAVMSAIAQVEAPKEITPALELKIKNQVEKEAKDFSETLSIDDMSKDQIEFSIDTFKIEHTLSKKMDLDYSTSGMNKSMDERTKSYDVLLNKYYNKLLGLLKADDKKVLMSAQRSWISFRDAETKLINTMTKDTYSGGGTIQSNIANGAYSDLIVSRTIDLFRYYDNMLKE